MHFHGERAAGVLAAGRVPSGLQRGDLGAEPTACYGAAVLRVEYGDGSCGAEDGGDGVISIDSIDTKQLSVSGKPIFSPKKISPKTHSPIQIVSIFVNYLRK